MSQGVYKRKPGIKYGNTGHKASDKLKLKLSLSHIGQKAWNKGMKFGPQPKELIEKRIASRRGIKRPPFSEEWKKNMSLSKLGKTQTVEHRTKVIEALPRGENHHGWIHDRTKLKDDHRDRGGQLHREWSKSVKKRDGWKCKICDCNENLVAHHILGWKSYPELRYDINNGITLCQAHHPRKREEEAELSPFFKQMVAEMK